MPTNPQPDHPFVKGELTEKYRQYRSDGALPCDLCSQPQSAHPISTLENLSSKYHVDKRINAGNQECGHYESQPDTCVQCDGELKVYAAIHAAIHKVEFPYCPNPACPNYGLVTVGRSGVDNG